MGRLPGPVKSGVSQPDRLGSVVCCSPGSGGVNGWERASSSAVLLSRLGGGGGGGGGAYLCRLSSPGHA